MSAVDYIPFLANTKEAYMRVEGTIFGGRPVRIALHLDVEDAYSSAGVLVDAIACAGHALRVGVGGVLHAACAWLCKHPPRQLTDNEASAAYQEFRRTLPRLIS